MLFKSYTNDMTEHAKWYQFHSLPLPLWSWIWTFFTPGELQIIFEVTQWSLQSTYMILFAHLLYYLLLCYIACYYAKKYLHKFGIHLGYPNGYNTYVAITTVFETNTIDDHESFQCIEYSFTLHKWKEENRKLWNENDIKVTQTKLLHMILKSHDSLIW